MPEKFLIISNKLTTNFKQNELWFKKNPEVLTLRKNFRRNIFTYFKNILIQELLIKLKIKENL